MKGTYMFRNSATQNANRWGAMQDLIVYDDGSFDLLTRGEPVPDGAQISAVQRWNYGAPGRNFIPQPGFDASTGRPK